MLKITVQNYWRDVNNYKQEKKQLFYKIIHFSMQFSAVLNIFIVKTLLNSIFTNDLKRIFFEKMLKVTDLASLSSFIGYISNRNNRSSQIYK